MPSLTRFLKDSASSTSEAKSKAYFKTGGTEHPTFFDKLGRDSQLLQKWDTIYRQGGIASQCIDAYPFYILSNGYRIEGDDDSLVEKVKEFCTNANINRALRAYITDSCVFGRPFIEILYGRGSMSSEPVGLKAIDPKTMRVNCDIRGNVISYTQIVNIDQKEYEVTFSKDEIWSDTLFPVSGDPYGLSLIGRAFDDIMHDAKISEATAEAILRHGFPKYHIRVGLEGEDVDAAVLRGLDMEFKNLKAKNEIATVHDVEITNLDKDAMPDIAKFSEFSISRMTTSMGIPEVCLGLGKGSTEATAKVTMRMLYDRISYLQKDIEITLNRDIIDKITKKPGAVKFTFNDANPVDEDEIATWMSKIMAMTQLDPFSAIPKGFVQEKLGINPDLYPEDEDDRPYGVDTEFDDNKDTYIAGINAKREVLPNEKDKMSKAGESDEGSKSEADKKPA